MKQSGEREPRIDRYSKRQIQVISVGKISSSDSLWPVYSVEKYIVKGIRKRIWRQPVYLSAAHQYTLAHAGLLLELVHVVLHQRAVPPQVKCAPAKLQLVPAALEHREKVGE